MATRNRESIPCYHGLTRYKCLLCFPGEDELAPRLLQDSQQENFRGTRNHHTQRPTPVRKIGNSHAQPISPSPLALNSQTSINLNPNTRQHLPNFSLSTSLTQPPFQPYAQLQHTSGKQSYNPRPNTIAAKQTYTMNRFHDEIPDFRARGILFGDPQADARNLGHRAALGTRMKRLEGMIGV